MRRLGDRRGESVAGGARSLAWQSLRPTPRVSDANTGIHRGDLKITWRTVWVWFLFLPGGQVMGSSAVGEEIDLKFDLISSKRLKLEQGKTRRMGKQMHF